MYMHVHTGTQTAARKTDTQLRPKRILELLFLLKISEFCNSRTLRQNVYTFISVLAETKKSQKMLEYDQERRTNIYHNNCSICQYCSMN